MLEAEEVYRFALLRFTTYDNQASSRYRELCISIQLAALLKFEQDGTFRHISHQLSASKLQRGTSAQMIIAHSRVCPV